MKFFTFKYEGIEEIGILTKDENKMIPINRVKLSQYFSDMNNFIKFHKKEDIEKLEKIWNWEEKSGVYYDLNKTIVLAPIPTPLHDIISIGLNYKAHLDEVVNELNLNSEIETCPIIFNKRAIYINGLNAVIPLHKDITQN